MFKTKLSFSLLMALFLYSAQQTSAQNVPPAESATPNAQTEAQLLRALLNEVRQLRLTLQKSSIRQLRSTLILDRMRRRQDLIDIFDMEINDVRAEIRDLTAEGRYDEHLDEIKDYETAINETNDYKERAELVQEQARMKRALERRKKMDGEQLERCREREREIERVLKTEREALADLLYQMETLEREMDRQLATAERQQAANNDSRKH